MAKYRKIYPRIWADEKFRTLNSQDKLLALYCLGSQQTNRIGLFVFSFGLAAEELGYPSDTLRKGMARVCSTLAWGFDDLVCVLYMPNWWRYNGAIGPKTIKGHLCDLDDLPENTLIAEFLENKRHLTESEAKVLDTYAMGIGGVSGGHVLESPQEQEQEQEQEEHSLSTRVDDTPKTGADELLDSERRFILLWNSLEGVRRVRDAKFNATRRAAFRTRMKSSQWRRDVKPAFVKFPLQSTTGDGEWKPDMEFILRPNSLTKILEGCYDWSKDNGREPPHEPEPDYI